MLIKSKKIWVIMMGIIVGIFTLFGVQFDNQSVRNIESILNLVFEGSPTTQEMSSLPEYDIVTRVVDGDTLILEEVGTVRLIGVDTPETKDPRKEVQCYGREASEYTRNVLENKEVRLEYSQDSLRDRYQRVLVYIYLESGKLFNAELIQQGYAFSYKSFEHPLMDDFNRYEEEARVSGQGLWGEKTCNGIVNI